MVLIKVSVIQGGPSGLLFLFNVTDLCPEMLTRD